MLLLAQFKQRKNSNEKDQNLWSALRRGQREALSELFRCHHKHLYNYGIKIVSNTEIVDGAIQELFLNIWKSRNRLSPASSVKAYLLSSLRRLIMKELKRNRKRAERNRNYIENEEALTFPVEDLLIRKEVAQNKREQLEKGLETLTPRQKEAVFLKYYHGLTNRELVEVMEINYQCVRNLLYEALERLRSHIESVSYQE
ncbi:RNA polymerase sigma-70 factor, ECF subfamily [Fodinibius roseus]|uniref:RNA polymerase sigma-70 factor, ECF subfamily n=1 Tax=Fodinibius roseus TaxID=1194090 RepID=A0A1M5FXW7_9BACT|nr:sigma-70 family RNA polymerase sigma factor [Fodinibius roseus]SHF96375.1 RNA polymerase sigma-70 factor, ECF subfamily [Fodinibius roseus]